MQQPAAPMGQKKEGAKTAPDETDAGRYTRPCGCLAGTAWHHTRVQSLYLWEPAKRSV